MAHGAAFSREEHSRGDELINLFKFLLEGRFEELMINWSTVTNNHLVRLILFCVVYFYLSYGSVETTERTRARFY